MYIVPRSWVFALVVGAFGASACSSSVAVADAGVDGGAVTSPDASSPVDASPGADSAPPPAGGCNAVALTAPPVTGVSETSAQPVPAGGTIADGTYFLTAHQTFGAPSAGVTYRAVMVFKGSTIELAQTRNGGAEERATLTLTTTGTKFAAKTTCPPGQSLSYDFYTATGTTLMLFDNEKVATLTKQ